MVDDRFPLGISAMITLGQVMLTRKLQIDELTHICSCNTEYPGMYTSDKSYIIVIILVAGKYTICEVANAFLLEMMLV